MSKDSTGVKYTDHHYGKANVKVARVFKNGKNDDIREYHVDVQLYGSAFESSYTEADNTLVIPTDTMKNTVYTIAKLSPMNNPIEYGIDLTNHFLLNFPHVQKVHVHIEEVLWQRVTLEDKTEHTHGFVDKQTHRNTCDIFNNREYVNCTAGISGLKVLKTKGSSFDEFLVDQYTSLKPAHDRIMCTTANINWKYDNIVDLHSHDHNEVFKKVKQIFVDNFVQHDDSKSVQHTIDVVGKLMFTRITELTELSFHLPNNHYLLANLFHLGPNNNEIFIQSSEPYGSIYATLGKSDQTLDLFNSCKEPLKLLEEVSQSKTLQAYIVNHRPYESIEHLLETFRCCFKNEMKKDDWLEAFKTCSRLGADQIKKHTYIKEEFDSNDYRENQLNELAELNCLYEAKFGHMFIISAFRNTLNDILRAIKARINNNLDEEFQECVRQLQIIHLLRIQSVLRAYALKQKE